MLYAQKLALKLKVPLHVCFCLVPKFLEATQRHYGFMLKGLQEVEQVKCTVICLSYIYGYVVLLIFLVMFLPDLYASKSHTQTKHMQFHQFINNS